MCCRMSVFAVLGVFDLVQDFISLVDAGASLLFAGKAGRVGQIPDDAPVL
jgi:hypothetical protein